MYFLWRRQHITLPDIGHIYVDYMEEEDVVSPQRSFCMSKYIKKLVNSAMFKKDRILQRIAPREPMETEIIKKF